MNRNLTTLTDSQRGEVETLAAVLTAQQLADYFGVGRTTFFAMMNRDPDLAERYKRGRARAVGSVAQSLLTKARSGNVTAMIFFLKTQGGWRETLEVDTRLEVAASNGQSAAERLAARLDAMADRMARADPALPVNPVAPGPAALALAAPSAPATGNDPAWCASGRQG